MGLKPGDTKTKGDVPPEGWQVSRLGTLCAGVLDCHHSTPVWTASGAIVIRNQNIKGGKLDLSQPSFTDEKHFAERTKRAVPSFGDLVITREAPMGLVCMIPEGLKCCLGQRMVLLRPDHDAIDAAFLLYALQGEAVQSLIAVAGGTGSTVSNLRIPVLKALAISAPPAREQRAIAEALGDADALLAALDRLIAKKRDLKQAAMQQLLTGRTRLPGFSGEWETCQVRDVIDRYFCGPSPTCEERNIRGDDEWGVLKTTCATVEAGWDWTAHKTLPKMFWGQTEIEVKIGDVIVTKAGPRHRVGVSAFVDSVPARVIPSGKMICLRPSHHRIEPLMLAAAIASRDTQQYLDQRTTGMAESQVNFENDVLLSAPIRIPRLSEQAGIAATLSNMKAELDVLEARRDKTRDLKQAMMQELLTGRTRLVRAEAEPC